MCPMGSPRVTVCQFGTVGEAGWVFSGTWKLEVSIMLHNIVYLAVRSVGRLKVCSPLHFKSCCEWQSFILGEGRGAGSSGNGILEAYLPSACLKDADWLSVRNNKRTHTHSGSTYTNRRTHLFNFSLRRANDRYFLSFLNYLDKFWVFCCCFGFESNLNFNVYISSLVHMYTHSLHIGDIDKIL